jgi:hypothetical protein
VPAFLAGKEQPADAGEQLVVAWLCLFHRRDNAAAVHFYAGFAARPKLADRLATHARYHAACAAALAADGHPAKRAYHCRRALMWLTADLRAWASLIRDRPQQRAWTVQTLQHWKAEAALAGLRDARRLARLSPEEQQACRKVWTRVDALIQQAQQKLTPRPVLGQPPRPETRVGTVWGRGVRG